MQQQILHILIITNMVVLSDEYDELHARATTATPITTDRSIIVEPEL